MSERSPPLGIQVIVVLGILAGVFSMFFEVGVVFGGGGRAGGAIVSLALSVVQVLVLLALLELKSWAWSAAVILFTFGAIVHFARGDVGSGLISTVILGYVYFQKSLFRTDRGEGTT